MDKFEYNPILQEHIRNYRQENIENVKNSEIFFIFGDAAYIKHLNEPNNDTRQLIELAKGLKKPFILCLDNSLPLKKQVYLRMLCPRDNTQVISFNPETIQGMGTHQKIMCIFDKAIHDGIIKDPIEKVRG